jgi:hypothetical protein
MDYRWLLQKFAQDGKLHSDKTDVEKADEQAARMEKWRKYERLTDKGPKPIDEERAEEMGKLFVDAKKYVKPYSKEEYYATRDKIREAVIAQPSDEKTLEYIQKSKGDWKYRGADAGAQDYSGRIKELHEKIKDRRISREAGESMISGYKDLQQESIKERDRQNRDKINPLRLPDFIQRQAVRQTFRDKAAPYIAQRSMLESKWRARDAGDVKGVELAEEAITKHLIDAKKDTWVDSVLRPESNWPDGLDHNRSMQLAEDVARGVGEFMGMDMDESRQATEDITREARGKAWPTERLESDRELERKWTQGRASRGVQTNVHKALGEAHPAVKALQDVKTTKEPGEVKQEEAAKKQASVFQHLLKKFAQDKPSGKDREPVTDADIRSAQKDVERRGPNPTQEAYIKRDWRAEAEGSAPSHLQRLLAKGTAKAKDRYDKGIEEHASRSSGNWKDRGPGKGRVDYDKKIKQVREDVLSGRMSRGAGKATEDTYRKMQGDAQKSYQKELEAGRVERDARSEKGVDDYYRSGDFGESTEGFVRAKMVKNLVQRTWRSREAEGLKKRTEADEAAAERDRMEAIGTIADKDRHGVEGDIDREEVSPVDSRRLRDAAERHSKAQVRDYKAWLLESKVRGFQEGAYGNVLNTPEGAKAKASLREVQSQQPNYINPSATSNEEELYRKWTQSRSSRGLTTDPDKLIPGETQKVKAIEQMGKQGSLTHLLEKFAQDSWHSDKEKIDSVTRAGRSVTPSPEEFKRSREEGAIARRDVQAVWLNLTRGSSPKDKAILDHVQKIKGNWKYRGPDSGPVDYDAKIKDIHERIKSRRLSQGGGQSIIEGYKELQEASKKQYEQALKKGGPGHTTEDFIRAKMVLEAARRRHADPIPASEQNKAYRKADDARRELDKAKDTQYMHQHGPMDRTGYIRVTKEESQRQQDRLKPLRIKADRLGHAYNEMDSVSRENRRYARDRFYSALAKDRRPEKAYAALGEVLRQDEPRRLPGGLILPRDYGPGGDSNVEELYRKWTQSRASRGMSTKMEHVAPEAKKELESRPETGKVEVKKEASLAHLLKKFAQDGLKTAEIADAMARWDEVAKNSKSLPEGEAALRRAVDRRLPDDKVEDAARLADRGDQEFWKSVARSGELPEPGSVERDPEAARAAGIADSDRVIEEHVQKSQGNWKRRGPGSGPVDYDAKIKDLHERIKSRRLSRGAGESIIEGYRELQEQSKKEYEKERASAKEPKRPHEVAREYRASLSPEGQTSQFIKAKMLLDEGARRSRDPQLDKDIQAARSREEGARNDQLAHTTNMLSSDQHGPLFTREVHTSPGDTEMRDLIEGPDDETRKRMRDAAERKQTRWVSAKKDRMALERERDTRKGTGYSAAYSAMSAEGSPGLMDDTVDDARRETIEGVDPGGAEGNVNELYRKWTQSRASRGKSTRPENVAPRGTKKLDELLPDPDQAPAPAPAPKESKKQASLIHLFKKFAIGPAVKGGPKVTPTEEIISSRSIPKRQHVKGESQDGTAGTSPADAQWDPMMDTRSLTNPEENA